MYKKNAIVWKRSFFPVAWTLARNATEHDFFADKSVQIAYIGW